MSKAAYRSCALRWHRNDKKCNTNKIDIIPERISTGLGINQALSSKLSTNETSVQVRGRGKYLVFFKTQYSRINKPEILA